MKDVSLHQKIAHLESVNDQLEAELAYVDLLMKQLGFSEGLQTVKATACEILAEQKLQPKKRFNKGI